MENKLAAKLLAVQKEISPIKKSETNPFFNAKYFDVNSLLEVLRPVLNTHGLVVTQFLAAIDGGLGLRTTVIDADTGENMSEICPVPSSIETITDKNGNTLVGQSPQKLGSAITYYRRYALQALFLLQAEDDDANATVAKQEPLIAPAKPKYEFTRKTPVKTPSTGTGDVVCNCTPPNPAIIRRQVKPGPNQGREFYTCPMPMNKSCNFFAWVDTHAVAVQKHQEDIVDYGQDEA